LEEKEKEIHLVKKISKELGLTYRELGEEIGYTEGNLRKSVSEDRLSSPLKKALELYLKVVKFQNEKEDTKRMKEILRTLIS